MKPRTLLNTKGVTTNQKIFGSWESARNADYRTENNWNQVGRSVPKKAGHTAIFDDGERLCRLFHLSQTKALRTDLAARWRLIRRFITHTDLFGYLSTETNQILHFPTEELYGSVKNLLYRSLDYRNRSKGIRISSRWKTVRADKIYLRAAATSKWFVFDLDNHIPTAESLAAHLKLLKHLINNLPKLQELFGPISVFYDYQQDAPRGIHIWVNLKTAVCTEQMLLMARSFVVSIACPEVNEELARNNLARIEDIEILPTENHLMQFFGSAGREVFTTQPLKPQNQAFDSIGLMEHLYSWNLGGDPTQRYGSLAELALNAPIPISIPIIPVDPQITIAACSHPARNKNYFTGLVDLCLRGVLVPDDLYALCLRPLAQALWFRDLFDHPDKKRLCIKYLFQWLSDKHNGNISRLQSGHDKRVYSQVCRVICKVSNTPEPIQKYWESVRSKDRRYPQKKISLIQAMQLKWDPSVDISKQAIGSLADLLEENKAPLPSSYKTYCIGGHFTSSQSTPSLPPSVLKHLETSLLANNQRKGKAYDRKLKFCKEFIYAIGTQGSKRISQNKLNQIGGYKLNTQPKTLRRYKALLVKANILKPGSYQKLQRNKASSLYELEDWVVEAWDQHRHPL